MTTPALQAADAAPEVPTSLADTLRSAFPADSLLLDRAFLIENWQWLGLLALIGVSVAFERFVAAFLRHAARRIATNDRVRLDEGQLTRFVRPFGLMVTWWVFLALLPALTVENETVTGVLDVVGSLIYSVAGVLAAWRLVDLVCDFFKARAQRTENKFDDMLVPLMRRTLKIFVVVLGLAYFSSRLTEDVYRVIAGLSIGSAALLFAFKDSLENVFGTFTVLMDQPFQLGDWITIDGIDGTVEQVGFRSTRIRTFYNSIITVPNRHFISAKVDNWGARSYRRIKTTLGVTYDTPPEKVEAFCEGIRELIRQHPCTRKDYYQVYFTGFGASCLEILVYAFVVTPDWSAELREKHRLFADILRLAERLEISFAFPTTSVHMVQAEDLEHPNRPSDDQAGEAWGREVAGQVAASSLAHLGGAPPPPVQFPNLGSAGSGSELEDGEG
jgi:MscS family membrane protein